MVETPDNEARCRQVMITSGSQNTGSWSWNCWLHEAGKEWRGTTRSGSRDEAVPLLTMASRPQQGSLHRVAGARVSPWFYQLGAGVAETGLICKARVWMYSFVKYLSVLSQMTWLGTLQWLQSLKELEMLCWHRLHAIGRQHPPLRALTLHSQVCMAKSTSNWKGGGCPQQGKRQRWKQNQCGQNVWNWKGNPNFKISFLNLKLFLNCLRKQSGII